MKWSGAAPFQCHSPGGVWIVSPGRISITSPPRDWIRPMPSVTCTVCPSACACHALRAPGAKRTTLTRIREGSCPAAMPSYQASPVNVSPGAFTVGFFGAISNGLLLAGLRRWPDVVVEERTEPPRRPVPAAPGAQPHAVLLPAGAGDIHVTGGGAGEGEPVVPGTDRTRQPTGTERNLKLTDNRREIREFLTSRRARISPAQAGLPAYGGSRRVAGLRREEVALLAGVSVDYYTRLERGNAHSASDSFLEALASALQLDEAEHAHLFDLAHGANTTPATRAPAGQRVRLSVQRILDSMTTTPAYVRNERMDILAANRLGRALYSPILTSPAQPANHARAAHNVRFHRTGVKRLHHPVVGDLSLTFEALDLAADAACGSPPAPPSPAPPPRTP